MLEAAGIYYLACQLDLPRGYLEDRRWQDKPEILPDGRLMLVVDIRAMLDGRPFRVFPGIGERAVQYGAISREEFFELFDLYENTRLWGLPGGRGWQHETPQVLSILRTFERLTDLIKDWQMRREAAAIEKR